MKSSAAWQPRYKFFVLVCYSTVAAIVATEAGLLGKPDAYLAEESHQAFVQEFERYLASNEVHPWCGTGRLEDTQVGYLVPYGDGGAT